jgi:hypothetical protein
LSVLRQSVVAVRERALKPEDRSDGCTLAWPPHAPWFHTCYCLVSHFMRTQSSYRYFTSCTARSSACKALRFVSWPCPALPPPRGRKL